MSTLLWIDGTVAWESAGRTAANRSNFLRTGGITQVVAARVGGMPDRPHHPAVELAQTLFGHSRKRVAVLLVPAFADRQRPPRDLEPLARGGRLHHLDALRNDFEADVVAQQNSNSQAHSSPTMPTSSTSRFQFAIRSAA